MCAQSVHAEAHTFTHTCLQVVSSWACLRERSVAGWFWFCLAPRESSQIFLLQGTPLPMSEGKPLHHPHYPMALPKQRAVKGPAFSSLGAQRVWQSQLCSFAVPPGPAVRAWALQCVQPQPGVVCPSRPCRTCLGACAVSVRNRLHFCPYKTFSPSKKDVRGGGDVGGRGTVLQLFRQFKMP